MARYRCSVCGYVYDEQQEGRPWSELPGDWVCPVCGQPRSAFEASGGEPQEATFAAPPVSALGRVAAAHRVFGYAFLALYVVLMWQMIPRLWAYQIEFPARTVLHVGLGMAIGVILLLKIGIVRFFKRLDPALVPMLGTSLLVGSVVLIGIAVPTAFREALATNRLFAEENRPRIERLLAQADPELPASECARLASPEELRAGQQVLRQQCIDCHDLRTVLARPRTPSSWRKTVERMADRTTMLRPLDEQGQWQVTAYLVAISPQLQQSVKQVREQNKEVEKVREAAKAVASGETESPAYDAVVAEGLFRTKCAECHETTDVDDSPPESEEDARRMVKRMVDEGLKADPQELEQIAQYLVETYVKKSKQE